RFRHESTYWEHIGHRWRGALALFDFQPQLSLSTIYYARAFVEVEQTVRPRISITVRDFEY
ncbi:hypothetical protein, partial [Haloarcula sp. CGMCC 1.2071]|uniref:hypothetical protein n=1 Tax=Haloarcula sp. CGMCC 1.2071 TaxID=3111454 RepID=UPI00300ED0D4